MGWLGQLGGRETNWRERRRSEIWIIDRKHRSIHSPWCKLHCWIKLWWSMIGARLIFYVEPTTVVDGWKKHLNLMLRWRLIMKNLSQLERETFSLDSWNFVGLKKKKERKKITHRKMECLLVSNFHYRRRVEPDREVQNHVHTNKKQQLRLLAFRLRTLPCCVQGNPESYIF